MAERVSADTPGLRALANYAGIKPVRLADAINDPANLFAHITEQDLERLVTRSDLLVSVWPGAAAAVAIFAQYWKARRKES